MTAKKSGKKTRARKPKGVSRGTKLEGRNGGTLIAGAGRGPEKGAPNAGRPPNEWKQSLRALADRGAVLAHVDAALLAGPRRVELDENNKEVTVGSTFFESALQYVTEHGYGKATQPMAHSGSVTLEGLLAAVNAPPAE